MDGAGSVRGVFVGCGTGRAASERNVTNATEAGRTNAESFTWELLCAPQHYAESSALVAVVCPSAAVSRGWCVVVFRCHFLPLVAGGRGRRPPRPRRPYGSVTTA